jgi:hypothetical protein
MVRLGVAHIPIIFASLEVIKQIYVVSSPVTGLEWPRGLQEVKVLRFQDNSTGRWSGCQPYTPAAFTPRKSSWYSFLLISVRG